MKVALFYHSLYSDWNHGNAHFLRGVVKELARRGHSVGVFEPENGWSLSNLVRDHGRAPLEEFKKYYPGLSSTSYDPANADLSRLVKDADVVIAHEWNEPELISQLGRLKKEAGFLLFFHDTHHRAASRPEELKKFDLSEYDGALAFGKIISNIYLRNGWAKNAWTWHEAADADLFFPRRTEKAGDLVWIGNWGDNERTEELHEFLINPVRKLKLKAKVYGVRYPRAARKALEDAGIEYGGWLPNYKVPEVFAKYKVTVHVPRRPYARLLPGIPTIRPFEALACGIPLICSPWDDSENLFAAGDDHLIASNEKEMTEALKNVLSDPKLSSKLSKKGLETIRQKHTCAHRANELESICKEAGLAPEKLYPLYQQASL